jgi:hypothetical protein
LRPLLECDFDTQNAVRVYFAFGLPFAYAVGDRVIGRPFGRTDPV